MINNLLALPSAVTWHPEKRVGLKHESMNMKDARPGFHWICIAYDDRKQYRHFSFMPSMGDMIRLTIPDEGWISLKVDSICFSDSEGEEFVCCPVLHCSLIA